jgi:hypothetical protein
VGEGRDGKEDPPDTAGEDPPVPDTEGEAMERRREVAAEEEEEGQEEEEGEKERRREEEENQEDL